MLWLVTLWKQYEFRPHFSAIRLMCNYFFKRAILLYLIPVFIYYSSTEEIFVIYDGYARIVLFPSEIYFCRIAFPLWNSKYIPHVPTHTHTRDEMNGWNELIFALCLDPSRYVSRWNWMFSFRLMDVFVSKFFYFLYRGRKILQLTVIYRRYTWKCNYCVWACSRYCIVKALILWNCTLKFTIDVHVTDNHLSRCKFTCISSKKIISKIAKLKELKKLQNQ